ncbi:tripartite tricarboxylate transporter substrate binding protein [Verticiella sediminum]|uniref:Tripartite tricarboxylate transporter substrate binding protein n=1 Tax=Verticiella sediminum TaxID=1247510 RepID=A0A556AE99_9BURK|nr:tripartite tricarboxylate transporter substrate binding protein [Verticiella sediminum]TSH91220.1 tripartite tricarboxylate transporter substrate binding protein [Verticiella sediminum]
MFRTIASVLFRAALVAALVPGAALAQSDLVRLIVPIGPGNPFDASARALAEGLSKVSGKNVIVENKAGAGGRIATSEVARAKPDGSVLLFTTAGHATNAGLYSNLPYDPVDDFTPIGIVSRSSGFALLVQADSPFKTIQDLIAAAKAKPDHLSYGSFGNGNTTHVIGAMFARAADIDLVHVPYKSPVTDFLGGHVNMVFMGASTALPLIKDGRVRALAISSEQPDPDFPGVPTFRELGYQDVDVPAWSGLLAPRDMPADKAQALFEQVSEAAKQPAFQDYLKLSQAKLVLMPPQAFGQALEADVARFRKVLPELGIKGD